MRTDSYLEDQHGESGSVSPFAGLRQIVAESAAGSASTVAEADHETAAGESPFESLFVAESPFSGEQYNEAQELETVTRDFLESIRDEDFEDALEDLLNEGAARALADAQQWSLAPSESEAYESLEQWLAPLTTEWERTIDGYTAGLENANLEGMSEQEFDELLESLESPAALENELFGKIVRGLANKAKGLVKQAVKFASNPLRGVADLAKGGLGVLKGIGKGLLGPLLRRLKQAGLGLLKGVLKKLVRPLTRLLPASVRPFVPMITKALGVSEQEQEEFGGSGEDEGAEMGFASELSRAFDNELATLLLAAGPGESGGLAGENYETPQYYEDLEAFESFEDLGSLEATARGNPVDELDLARARLAAQLTEYSGAEGPVGPIQEFLPAVLAIRPLLKLGLQVTGARSALINLLARPLASLIRGIIGPANVRRIATVVGQEPDTVIARAGVGLAFTALGLESATGELSIPGEALASAIEATALRVLDELPEEAMTDPLQVSAAVQRLFSEAVAAYLPDRVLRSDLPEKETTQEGGLWVMMPRATGPRYRFRRYTRVLRVPITRQAARVLPWCDGGTLEQYLLDIGVRRWPVQAEVDLYETLPGSLVGHFTRDETLPTGENPVPQEYQLLTPEVAGILLAEPRLGRPAYRVSGSAGSTRGYPGQRYYRVRIGQFPARRTPRPRRVVAVRWDPTRSRLRVLIRLSERRARILQAHLQRSAPAGQKDLPAVLNALRETLHPRLRRAITQRLMRSSATADPATAARLAARLSGATMTGLSNFLLQRGAQLTAAVANSAEGITVVITFDGVSAGGHPVATPDVAVHPGWTHA
ncbi:MAG: hypothetical protein QOE23_357 [Pseudonocardiales bacterium]|jgi:hypothetical protein|nr:hypothetical protein [Pseudonocardiales bacterium]